MEGSCALSLEGEGHKSLLCIGKVCCYSFFSINVYLRGIGWKVVDWIHLAQDRDQWRAHVNTVMKLPVP
jgi:hypothetical protein